jgi:ABC-type Na+ efflux pump permease subunit
MIARTILILVDKEYRLLLRNKIFLIFSLAPLAALIALHYMLPSEISQAEPSVAVYSEADASAFFNAWDEGAEAVRYERMQSAQDLMDSVNSGGHTAGIIITEKILKDIEDGITADVILYTAPGLADEHVRSISFIIEIVFSEMVYRKQDSEINIAISEFFVGEDILENVIPFKNQMIPLMVSMLLVMEVFSLGISLVEEKESRSIKAVLAAPVSMGEFLLAKSLAGISVIFLQILIYLAATGALVAQVPAVLWVVFAGAVLTTGVSALLAAFSIDMMSLVSKGVFAMIVMMVPLSGILFPGMLSPWMRVIPTYMLADSMSLLINRGAIWHEAAAQITALSITAATFLTAGILCIRRAI